MGNVFSSTTLAPMAVRLAWICQMLLDPKYSCIEDNETQIARPPALPDAVDRAVSPLQQSQPQQTTMTKAQQQESTATSVCSTLSAATSPEATALVLVCAKPAATLAHKSAENGWHQENRKRRAAQLRFKTRPSSFDAALIVRKNKSSLVLASTPSPRRQQRRVWDASSSSGCSSDSGTNTDSDSETELRVSGNASNNEDSSTTLGMSAEEEEAFRLTVGRGYFTRSKKDRFLNHLRLEKRLNDLNNEYLSIACKNHQRQTLQRRHSGDLHRIC